MVVRWAGLRAVRPNRSSNAELGAGRIEAAAHGRSSPVCHGNAAAHSPHAVGEHLIGA
jgi:hypothetical protein